MTNSILMKRNECFVFVRQWDSLPQEEWGAESRGFKPLPSYEQLGIFPVQRQERAGQTIQQLSALDHVTSLLKHWC